MAIVCCTSRELSAETKENLESSMAAFYKSPPSSYYALANESASQYLPDRLPFHCDLAEQVKPGMRVGEFGCGTAHFCTEVEKRGGFYTGFDWSPELLESNRARFPKATFHSVEGPTVEIFDLVVSLYTIEHVVQPTDYLTRLWGRCRPGGLIGIICPEFIDSPSLAPSVFYGKTARRFREKCRTGDFSDAFQHLLDWKMRGPRWKASARRRSPGAFWINLQPRALYDGDFTIDADAVHLVRLADLVWWFQQARAEIMRTSLSVPDVAPEILTYNAYVLVRKPMH